MRVLPYPRTSWLLLLLFFNLVSTTKLIINWVQENGLGPIGWYRFSNYGSDWESIDELIFKFRKPKQLQRKKKMDYLIMTSQIGYEIIYIIVSHYVSPYLIGGCNLTTQEWKKSLDTMILANVRLFVFFLDFGKCLFVCVFS